MRVLDEVADAICSVRVRFLPLLSDFRLETIFERPVTPKEWGAIARSLACRLPPLEFVLGHWFLPEGFETIWDLVERAARAHPDWEPPAERTAAAWRNAQVFAGVRTVLAYAGALDQKQVVREARLKRDLGLE
jgi:hypothetical protein